MRHWTESGKPDHGPVFNLSQFGIADLALIALAGVLGSVVGGVLVLVVC